MTVQDREQFKGLVVHKLPQPHALVPRACREQRRGRRVDGVRAVLTLAGVEAPAQTTAAPLDGVGTVPSSGEAQKRPHQEQGRSRGSLDAIEASSTTDVNRFKDAA